MQIIKRYKLIPGQIDSLENLNLLLNEYAKKQSRFNFFSYVKEGKMKIVISKKAENLDSFGFRYRGPFFNPKISFTVKITGEKCEIVGVRKDVRLLVFIVFSAWFMIFSVSALVNGESLKSILIPILPIIGTSILFMGSSPGIKKTSKEILQLVDDFFNEHFEILN